MSDETNDNRNDEALGLEDQDRLPWLETADGYDYEEGASPLKVAAMVLGGLVLLLGPASAKRRKIGQWRADCGTGRRL